MGDVNVAWFDILLAEDSMLDRPCGPCSVLVGAAGLPLWWMGMDGSSGRLGHEHVASISVQKNSKELLHRSIRQRLFNVQQEIILQPVSVVICTRDRTELLRRCLASVVHLDHPCYEVMVVDNAPSSNSTRELVEELGLNYVHEPRPGLDNARNAGIMAARHNIIAFTDDDVVVDRWWLRRINAVFMDERVEAVTGFVAPLSLSTKAQQLFEWGYGGMSHGFRRILFDGRRMSVAGKLHANSCGVGANMSYRKQALLRAGLFDPQLDVGTPSGGGGDVEMFSRLLFMGASIVYDPAVLVWHEHRKAMPALRRQVFNNGRSFGCHVFMSIRKGRVTAWEGLRFLLREWGWRWLLGNLAGGGRVSRSLLFFELLGMASSPYAYWRTRRRNA